MTVCARTKRNVIRECGDLGPGTGVKVKSTRVKLASSTVAIRVRHIQILYPCDLVESILVSVLIGVKDAALLRYQRFNIWKIPAVNWLEIGRAHV